MGKGITELQMVADTELPAVAALADATANPTTSIVASALEVFNGTTWDRARSGQTSNSTTVTGFQNLLPMARYNATPTARTEGQFGNFQTDANGNLNSNLGTLIAGEDQTNTLLAVVEKPLAVSTYTPDLDTSAAAEASSVTKAAAGVLYGATFSNGTASTVYFQFFNSTTLPADATVPVVTIACAANNTVSAEWPKGRYFSTGIVWCGSTTQNTKTIGGASFLGDVHYK